VKRGPARPLRLVPKDVLDMRIEKLDKRLKRITSQMEDASRHYAAYIRERDFWKGGGIRAVKAAYVFLFIFNQMFLLLLSCKTAL